MVGNKAAFRSIVTDLDLAKLVPCIRSNLIAGNGPRVVDTMKGLYPGTATNWPAFPILDDSR